MDINREKEIVAQMIRLYCRKKEHNKELCSSCADLISYATERLNRCPFGNKKGACKKCRIHCYKPEMRQRIKEVMRFAGPRMMLCSPIVAIRHLLGK